MDLHALRRHDRVQSNLEVADRLVDVHELVQAEEADAEAVVVVRLAEDERNPSLCANQSVSRAHNSSESLLGENTAVLAGTSGNRPNATPSSSLASMAWRL